jgi:hypothetical protein
MRKEQAMTTLVLQQFSINIPFELNKSIAVWWNSRSRNESQKGSRI